MKFKSCGILFILILSLYISSVSIYGQVADTEPNARLILSEIQDSMASVKEIKADFNQEKKLSLFKHTIELKGNLEIKFPHYFRWEVISPLKTIITADGDRVTTWDEETDKTQTISVKNNPVVKSIWTQIDSWFLGKYDELSKNYYIKLIQSDPAILEFEPKSKTIAATVKKITVWFRKDKKYLKQVKLQEKGGDSTTIKFSNIRLNGTDIQKKSESQ